MSVFGSTWYRADAHTSSTGRLLKGSGTDRQRCYHSSNSQGEGAKSHNCRTDVAVEAQAIEPVGLVLVTDGMQR